MVQRFTWQTFGVPVLQGQFDGQQRFVPHVYTEPMSQPPNPSHLPEHVLLTQEFPDGKLHVSAVPSHVPAQEPLPPQLRPPTGPPAGTGEQVPSLPATLHASQLFVHVELQQ